tara:strand:- start:518 stop:721 length:204 start_codon:yes stop_codon:yes gene_type:complete
MEQFDDQTGIIYPQENNKNTISSDAIDFALYNVLGRLPNELETLRITRPQLKEIIKQIQIHKKPKSE